MSSAILLVRFPNGDIRFGFYFGTSDVALPKLITEPDGWYDLKGTPWPSSAELASLEGVEDVEVYSDYGGGFSWPGRATRDWLVEGHDPFDGDRDHDGTPQWAADELVRWWPDWKPWEWAD